MGLGMGYLLLILIWSISLALGSVSLEIPVKRFEYKWSFKPPYLAQKDGTVRPIE